MAQSKVYRNPQAGTPLITTIGSNFKTPLLAIKYSNLVRPFFYPNSPAIARYSITCVLDPEEHKEFLKTIQNIEKSEKVETIIKNDNAKEDGVPVHTGKLNIKFQSKDKVPVYVSESNSTPELIEVEDEIARGEKVMVVYDILRYTKKNTMKTEHGISFKPTAIYYYPSKPLQTKEG